MSKTDLIISGLRGPCSDCEGNEHDTCIRCQLEFDAADEIERLLKRDSENKHHIHELRKRLDAAVRDMEAMRAELARIHTQVPAIVIAPYKVQNLNPGVDVEITPVVRHFDGINHEPHWED